MSERASELTLAEVMADFEPGDRCVQEYQALLAERDRLHRHWLSSVTVEWHQREMAAAEAERDEAQRGLETERIRLAACTAAALGNTLKAVEERLSPNSPYYSASYRDVCDAVDREMEQRGRAEQAEAENARLTAERDEARGSANKLRGHLEAALKRWRTWRERARQAEAENARLQERVRRLEASIDIEQATDALEDMGNECIEKSSQIEALQAALEQAAVALSRYATWPNDDIGGLRYHAMQDAKAARQQALKGGA